MTDSTEWRTPRRADRLGGGISVRLRTAAGLAVLLVLFLSLVTVQLVVGDHLRTDGDARARRIAEAIRSNQAALQHMTDAETGIRGFQLTGKVLFLEPYESGRAAAFAEFGAVVSTAGNAEVRQLAIAEQSAATRWLYGYAIPIVNAGRMDTDATRLAAGKQMFDDIRTANADVDAAITDEQQAREAAETRLARLAQLLFATLAAAILAVGLWLGTVQMREVLAPVEHIRRTLRRLSSGDHSARAIPAGPLEMRALADSLNDLAAETEGLLAAEQARVARSELRQAVAAELRADRSPREVVERVAERLGTALDADRVHCRVAVRNDAGVAVAWPAGTADLDAGIVAAVRDAEPYVAADVAGLPGAVAMALSGDADCPPTVICLVRDPGRGWSDAERRLLTAAGREIDHAVRQRRLQLSQDRLISELRTLDEQKDVFVSTVTHELRTPLTSILGYAEMLNEDDEASAQHRRGLEAILRNAERLEATVGDLLLLDRSAERAGAEPGPVDLSAIVTGLHQSLTASARAKDLHTTLEAEPVWVNGDAADLERALRNLMENAIKFTPAGGRIGCRVAREGEQVVITVTDTGIGIPEKDVSGLFTPFHRAGNAMAQAVQGSGLGLAIVRTIVTEHGGDVSARSELDRGSSFTVRLPAAVMAAVTV